MSGMKSQGGHRRPECEGEWWFLVLPGGGGGSWSDTAIISVEYH